MTYTIEACGKLGDMLPQPLTLSCDARTVNDLLAQLAEQYPIVAADMPRTAIARGASILDRSAEIQDGDTLALIPPVGGG